jgi:hypothetical protein
VYSSKRDRPRSRERFPEQKWPAWLGEAPSTNDELKAMLGPLPPDQLQMWPVDLRVGNVKNDGADLAVPITLSAPDEPAYGSRAGSGYQSARPLPSSSDKEPYENARKKRK